jgi:dTDP-4-dehydrorhamnose reductase
VRIVITGAGGGLGRALQEVLPGHHDVVPLTHADLDVGDHHAVMQTIPALHPDLVVNAAAFTAVDDNERDPARAFRDNAQGPQSLALAARACGSVVLHVSTDFVFDGQKQAPYDETDPPAPLCEYGRSKLAGEVLVRRLLPEHYIVRTGFVFGSGTDYIARQVESLRAGGPAAAIHDRIGTPTYVRHLAERLIPLALTGRFGTYHLAGPEPTTWFDVCRRLAARIAPGASVEAQAAADLDLPARRPRNSALTSVFMENLSLPPFPPLDEALDQLIDR